jgi:protein SCO1
MAESPSPRRRPPWFTAILVAATVGVVLGLGAVLATSFLQGSHASAAGPTALRAQVTWAAGTKPAPQVALRDQRGSIVSLRSLRGHVVALTFLASTCKRECPLEGRVLHDVLARVRDTGMVALVVSVDPWADTRASTRAFASRAGWSGDWRWLLGSRAVLSPVWRAYHVVVKRVPGDVLHSAALYVIDPRGDLRAAYLFPFSAAAVSSDVRRLASRN